MNIVIDKYAWSSCEPTELQESLRATDLSVCLNRGSGASDFHIDVTLAMIREMTAWKIFSETGYEIRYLLPHSDRIELHFVESGDGENPLTALDAFRAFQNGVRERCAELPQTSEATIIGNYRMLGEQ